MKMKKLYPALSLFWLTSPLLLLFLTGCADCPSETRYNGARVYRVGPNDGARVYRVGLNDGARVYRVGPNDGARVYRVGPNDGARVYRVGPNDNITACYRLRTGAKQGQSQVQTSPVPPTEPVATDEPIMLTISHVLFDFDKWDIKPEYYRELDPWTDYLKSNPELSVIIIGHTDSTGPASYNQKLSEKRAQSVLNYLVGKGVDKSRMSSKGYGESRPVAPNTTKDGRQKNRRAEMDL